MVKKAKVARLTRDLLATKGNALPANAVQEDLGPDNVALAVSQATNATARKGKAPPAASSTAGRGGRKKPTPSELVALSIRLGPERHRRLEMAKLRLGQTAEGVVIAALDEFLERVSDPAAVEQDTAIPAQRRRSRKKTTSGPRRKR